jgi:hypothetical protein
VREAARPEYKKNAAKERTNRSDYCCCKEWQNDYLGIPVVTLQQNNNLSAPFLIVLRIAK